MAEDFSDRTRASLLAKLQHPENRLSWDGAWEPFFQQYHPLMLRWCRHYQLQPSDAEDITANVLLTLSKRLKTFDYDPSKRFRGWLKTVVENEVRDFFLGKGRQPGNQGRGGPGPDPLGAVPDWRAAAEELVREIEAERRLLLDQAMECVRCRVEPATWGAFQRLSEPDGTGREVANELGMTVVAVHKAKSRVIEMIRQTVDQLAGRSSTSP